MLPIVAVFDCLHSVSSRRIRINVPSSHGCTSSIICSGFLWRIGLCADAYSLIWPALFRLPAYSCIHNILRRKGKANRECDKYRHPFCKSIPWYSDRQPSAVFHLKNRVFLTEYHEIPCLHSLFCSPSSKRCKKLIPDGIQPIKKNCPWGGKQKVKSFSLRLQSIKTSKHRWHD